MRSGRADGVRGTHRADADLVPEPVATQTTEAPSPTRTKAPVKRTGAAARVPRRVIMEQLAKRAERIAASMASASPEVLPTDVDPDSNRGLGYRLMLQFSLAADQWQYLDALWQRESGWNRLAENASSGAYGIPQSLPGSKMADVAPDWRTNAETQITWGLAYIAARYDNPQARGDAPSASAGTERRAPSGRGRPPVGAAWQLLDRRDLVDRLTLLAACRTAWPENPNWRDVQRRLRTSRDDQGPEIARAGRWPRLTRAKDPESRAMAARFLTRAQVAEELNISMAPCCALLRRSELRAAKIGARGDYRIGRDDLEAYIERPTRRPSGGSRASVRRGRGRPCRRLRCDQLAGPASGSAALE